MDIEPNIEVGSSVEFNVQNRQVACMGLDMRTAVCREKRYCTCAVLERSKENWERIAFRFFGSLLQELCKPL